MDYKKLGLKVGLEIHQQLNTSHKLFCHCPPKKSIDFPIEIKRKMRAVTGELGEFDPAALYEFLRDREFIYKINSESSCLIELDESPPLDLNLEALSIALQVSKLLYSDILDEIHVMRKTVIDGSAVSGFQRTSLIALNGKLETSFGKIDIETVSLEEDSAPALKKYNGTIEYRLDRLGVPLIEIATAPQITSPEMAKEAAEKIGLILRSTKVMRGIGTIRQDINISISGGSRIEIKGFQELEKIPKIVENEAARQVSLLGIKEELHKRGLRSIISKPEDVTNLFKETKNNLLRKKISQGERIHALVLPKFFGLLKKQCGDRTFGSELNGYAQAFGMGMIHSDEDLQKYQITYEFSELRKKLKAEERDIVLIIAGKNPEKAVNSVLQRAKYCLVGVPEETRVADDIGSKYTRPLPGSARIYPETDIRPIRISEEILEKIEIPKTLIEKEKDLKKILGKELAGQLIHSRYLQKYEHFASEFADHVFIANTFLSTFIDLRRKGYEIDKITDDHLYKIFDLVQKGRLSKKSVSDVLALIIEGKNIDEALKKYELMSEKELRMIIADVIKKNKDQKESVIMGFVMKEVKGRADGENAIRLIKEMKR